MKILDMKDTSANCEWLLYWPIYSIYTFLYPNQHFSAGKPNSSTKLVSR